MITAFEACTRSYDEDIIDFLALKVTSDFEKKVVNDSIHVEDIQDSVERVLGKADYADVAKAYILYRKQREKLRQTKSTLLDYKMLIDKYLKIEDWRVRENSTVTYSIGGLILSNSGAVTANYWLNEIYDQEIADAHKNADIHMRPIHAYGYCAGWSLNIDYRRVGRSGRQNKSSPARHLSTLATKWSIFGHYAK